MDRIAVLSDIHGNMTALNAVLADIDAKGIRRIFNLGDLFGKGPNGSAVVAATRARCEATVRGNWDVLVDVPFADASPALRWWLEELGSDGRDWLRALPYAIDLTLGGVAIRLFHASPDSEHHRVHRRHTGDEFRFMFTNTDATGDDAEPDLVVYGDIHAAYIERVGPRTLINTGSVGNPLDEPTSSYLVLSADEQDRGVDAGIVRVPYDIEEEIAIAAEREMPDLDAYAVELRTAVYRGLQSRART